MTDPQTITDYADDTLRMRRLVTGDLELRISHRSHAPGHSVEVEPAELLAVIDRLDPDAMRAYLRETLDATPEADSPEDVDERRHCDPLTDEQLAELRESGRTLGAAWRTFTEAVREGRFGADR